MSSNPYASPESDVSSHTDGAVVKSSIWTKKGRLSVLSYWGRSLLLVLVGYLITALAVFATALVLGIELSPDQLASPESLNPLLAIPVVVVFLFVIWVAWCQIIKRFHDLNLNGWWVLTIFIVIGVIALFIPGKENPNRFGGWRQTRMWEKILGVIYLLILLASIVAPIIGLGLMGGFGALGS